MEKKIEFEVFHGKNKKILLKLFITKTYIFYLL
jgi:hypothetical protein